MARTLIDLEEQFRQAPYRTRSGSREYTGAVEATLDFSDDLASTAAATNDASTQGYIKNIHASADLKYKLDPDVNDTVRGEVTDWADATERTLEAGEVFNWGIHGPEVMLRIRVNSDGGTTDYRCFAGR